MRNPDPKRVAVAFGGPSPEHDVSILTGLQAARVLARVGTPATGLYWTKTGEWFEVDSGLEAEDFKEGVPRKAKSLELRLGAEPGFYDRRRRAPVDVVVNCCHGGPGEDGTLQGAFDLAGIRYTGPDATGAALGMDKLAFGAVMAAAGLPTLPRLVLSGDSDSKPDFPPPFLVKPRFGGSSIGIEVVDGVDTARSLLAGSPHLRRGAVIEPYLPESRDVNIAIRSYPSLELSAIEEPHRAQAAGEILSYEDKYMRGQGLAGAARDLPAQIPDTLASTIRAAARQVATLVGVRGVARLDFLLSGDDLFVNEINTVPGLLSSYLWVDPPVAFERLLTDMIAEAERSTTRAFSTAGADGALLRSARSIDGKLGF